MAGLREQGVVPLGAPVSAIPLPAGEAAVAVLTLGQQRNHALLTALPMFRLPNRRVLNHDLRAFTAQLRGLDPDTVTTTKSPTKA